MSFSDYKMLAQVQQEYQIRYDEATFIDKHSLTPTDSFLIEFNFNIKTMDVFSSEAARCELLIFPVLREIYKRFSAGRRRSFPGKRADRQIPCCPP